MKEKEKRSTRSLKPIPRAIFEDEILQKSNHGWYIGTRKLQPEEVRSLKDDADAFGKSFLWEMMRREIHYLAYLRATAKAANSDDILYGNSMYRNLEILEKFIEECRTL